MREQVVRLRRNVRVAGKKGWERRNVPVDAVRKPGRGGWQKAIDAAIEAYGPEVIALGQYYVCWSERQTGGTFKSRYEPAGFKYSDATEKLAAKHNWLNHVEPGCEQAGVPAPDEPGQTETLPIRMRRYLDQRLEKETLAASSVKVFEIAFREFVETTRVVFIEQISVETLDRFVVAMRKRGRHQTTISGYFAKVATFLRTQGRAMIELLEKYAPPKPAQKNPDSYDEEDVDALLRFCYSQPRHITRPNYFKIGLVAEFLYKTGLRKKELSHLTWDAVDRNTAFFAIEDNRKFHLTMRGGKEKDIVFRTKTRLDRQIDLPIEEGLRERLLVWRKENPRQRFVFPTQLGNPDTALLGKLRTVILHAGLNCGTCDACVKPCGYCGQCRCGDCGGCRKQKSKQGTKCLHARHGNHPCTGTQCKKWTLHKMRHSFITKAVGDNVDLKTVMDMTGQKRLSTVEKYLSVVKKRKAQDAINRVFASHSDYSAGHEQRTISRKQAACRSDRHSARPTIVRPYRDQSSRSL